MRDAVIVLDNEALQALADPGHRKHRVALALVAAANGRSARRGRPVVELLTSPTVRIEAGLARDRSEAATLNRLRIADVPLDGRRADRAAALRTAVPGASVVDATVAEIAVRRADEGVVTTVLTSDRKDLTALVLAAGAAAGVRIQVL